MCGSLHASTEAEQVVHKLGGVIDVVNQIRLGSESGPAREDMSLLR
jgi:osmotically-inducible protein OsmY